MTEPCQGFAGPKLQNILRPFTHMLEIGVVELLLPPQPEPVVDLVLGAPTMTDLRLEDRSWVPEIRHLARMCQTLSSRIEGFASQR